MTSKRTIPPALRRQVQGRAGGRCEYCLVHNDDMLFPYEADHVIAEQHHGKTTLDNLAWACPMCNRFKGTNIASIDPTTDEIVSLFNPRKQQWRRHFRLNGAYIDPLTASGRATVSLLQLNNAQRIRQRLVLIELGHYPPKP